MFYVLLLEPFHLSSSSIEPGDETAFFILDGTSWISGAMEVFLSIWWTGRDLDQRKEGLRLETTSWIWPYLQPVLTVLHRMEEAWQVFAVLDLKSGLWRGVGTVMRPTWFYTPCACHQNTDPYHNPGHGLYIYSSSVHLLSMTIKHCVYYSSSSSDISVCASYH